MPAARGRRVQHNVSAERADEVVPGYVIVGRVVGTWGLRGDFRVDQLAPIGPLSSGRNVAVSGRKRTIERTSRHGRFLRVKLRGIDSHEDAQELRGAYLQALESSLEPLAEGEYYRFQLLGLAVRGSDGSDLGRVTDILSTPGNDVYVVNGPIGEILVPAIDDVVRDVDIETGEIIIEIVPGLLPH